MEEISTGYGLIEGPVWDASQGLYYSDVINGGVFLLDRSDNVSQVVTKRRGIGGMALHAAAILRECHSFLMLSVLILTPSYAEPHSQLSSVSWRFAESELSWFPCHTDHTISRC